MPCTAGIGKRDSRDAVGFAREYIEANSMEPRHPIVAEGAEVSLTKCQWRTPLGGF